MQTAILKNWFLNRRKRKIEKELGDFFQWLANCLKANLGLPTALELAAKEIPPPLGEEVQIILDRVKMGKKLDEALLASEQELKIPDFSLMVYSIIILREVGGNFIVHFEDLAKVLRERERVSEKVRSLTFQGLFQGVLLACLPFFLGVALFILSPEFLKPLWETKAGWMIVMAVVILDLGGLFWMKRMARIEI